jgi:hypothetical protein
MKTGYLQSNSVKFVFTVIAKLIHKQFMKSTNYMYIFCLAIVFSMLGNQKIVAQGTAISDQASPTPNANAILDLQPSLGSKKTLILPRLTNFNTGSVAGMAYYDSTNHAFKFFQNGTWVGLGSSGTLAVSGGGTGLTSGTQWGLPYYSAAGTMASTAAPATSGMYLRGISGNAPIWSTLILPNSSTQNRILYSSASNTVGEISSANTSALITNSSGVPSFTSGTTTNRVLRTDGTTISFAQVALGTDVTGNLSVNNLNGGSSASITTFWRGDGSWATPSITTNLSGGGAGQIPYQSGSGTTTFLSAGTSGYVMTYGGSNAPQWTQYLGVASGGTGAGTYTSNGVLYGNGTGALQVTAASAGAGYFLQTTSSGGTPSWAQTLGVANGGTGLTIGTQFGIPYFSATGTMSSTGAGTQGGVLFFNSSNQWASSGLGTSGQFLQSNGTGTPTWVNGLSNPMTTTGDIIYASSTATPAAISRLATGATAGMFLRSQGSGNALQWSTLVLPNSATTGDLLYANASNTIGNLADVTAGSFLRSGGASTAPVWSTSTIPTSSGTTGKILVSDGTNYILSTPTFPNASATARKIIVSDGTNWIASTETHAVPGTAGNVMASDGTNWSSVPIGANASIVATANTTTTSNSYTGLTGATVNAPSTGTYLVTFSGYFQNNTAATVVYLSLYNNGSALSNSEVAATEVTANYNFCLHTTSVMSVTSGQPIAAYWYVSANTGKCIKGLLTYVRIQ